MKEHYEMVIHSAEHISMLTKVLMMFSRRRIEVASVQSSCESGYCLYRIVFLATREQAAKLLLVVKRTVDILDANITSHNVVDMPIKRQRASRIVHVVA